MRIISFIKLVCLFTLIFASLIKTTQADMVKQYDVTIEAHNFTGFKEMSEGHDLSDYKNWDKLELNRMFFEMLVFKIAPVLGGCECEINIKGYSSDTPHVRSIAEVKRGTYISHPITAFEDDERIQDGFYLSDAILDSSQFFVGLYTHSKREELLELGRNHDYEGLKKLRYIAGVDWKIDHELLSQLGVERMDADSYRTLLDLIIAKRADVVLQPFQPGADMGFGDGKTDQRFVPIPNVKIRFPHSRRYFISKAHPDGEAFLKALNKGMQILKSSGELEKGLIHAGVINPNTDNFTILFE